MYKIMLLVRDSATQPLWSPYKVSVSIDDEESVIDFETDDINVLEDTIKELLMTRPQKTLKAVMDMDYVVDVVIGSV